MTKISEKENVKESPKRRNDPSIRQIKVIRSQTEKAIEEGIITGVKIRLEKKQMNTKAKKPKFAVTKNLPQIGLECPSSASMRVR